MERIELIIKENGSINCVYYNEDTEQHIIYNNEIKFLMESLINTKINSVFLNGNIYFGNDDIMIAIKNYKNSKNEELNSIIAETRKIYFEQKRKELKNKKITRIKKISKAIVITIGLITILSSFKLRTDLNESETKNTEEKKVVTVVETSNDIKKEEVILDVPIEINDLEHKKEEINETIKITELDVDSRVNSDKYISTKNNYFNIINSIASEYGVDPNIMLAIATQETGKHIINESSPAMGLMQIEVSVWNEKEITAYNHKKGKYETLYITKDKLKDLEFNIRVACMYFKDCLEKSKYDLNIAIQMYNFGYGNIESTFKMYHNNNSYTLNDSLKSYDDEWLKYRDYIGEGDKDYLEHIISYLEPNQKILIKDNEGEEIKYMYKIDKQPNENKALF